MMKLNNYFNLLIDDEIDSITKSPICIDGISHYIENIYVDLKKNLKGKFQQTIKSVVHPRTFNSWKNDDYPVPIFKIKELIKLWKNVCNKSEEDSLNLYNNMYESATYFRAMNSPVRVKVVKEITKEISYLLGIIFADGSLRNIWRTFEKKGRFKYEISVADKTSENLETIKNLFGSVFGIKTNVKSCYNGRWYRILFHSLILHRLLNKVFQMPMGYKKGKLRIPKLIKNSTTEVKKFFLIGFFDGDGTCVNSNINPLLSVSQSSEKILRDLNKILEESDLKFNLRVKSNSYGSWYDLETKNKMQILKFQQKFGFLYRHKKSKLEMLTNKIKEASS